MSSMLVGKTHQRFLKNSLTRIDQMILTTRSSLRSICFVAHWSRGKDHLGATPVTLEDEAFVQIANAMFKHFSNKAKKDDVETDVVSHVAKVGRCLIEILVNTDNPFEPKIQLKMQ